MAKALVLFSGGLDSLLACLILKRAGVKVVPICFESYFFGCEGFARYLQPFGLTLRVESISEDHLEVVRNPAHGWGDCMNPCIDCHLVMLKKAKAIMEEEGFDFIATGEVLGQRPFSQRKEVLIEMERLLGLEKRIVRPLTQKALWKTEPEEMGLIHTDTLYGVQGRSRKGQLHLVKEFGIKEYRQSGGGCILTDPEYSKRLKRLLKLKPNFSGNDAILLRNGRTIFEGDVLYVVGRNEKENSNLKKLKTPGDILLVPSFAGPSVILRRLSGNEDFKEEQISYGVELIRLHSTKPPQDYAKHIEIK